MPAIKLEQMGGMLPAWEPHLLPSGQAAASTNCYLFSGALQGWRLPKFLRNLANSAAQFVYRIPVVSQSVAYVYLVFEGLPVQGNILTVGEDTYTFTNTIVNPYDVLIDPGASIPATAQNLLNAITFDNGTGANEGILYGNNTIQNSAVASPQNNAGNSTNVIGTAVIGGTPYTYLQIFAPDYGAAYNSTAIDTFGTPNVVALPTITSLLIGTIYFVGGTNPTFDSTITGNATWLEFLDPDTNVVKNQTVNDIYQRYYWASPSAPPQYNTLARIKTKQPSWLLGINPPGCAPGVTVAGGGNAATIGNTTSDGNIDPVFGNAVYLIPIIPTGTFAVNDIAWMPQSTDPNVNFQAVIYEDQNPGSNVPSAPGQLIAAGNNTQGISAGTLAITTFTNPPGLNANVPYWIGFAIDTSESASEGPNPNSSGWSFINTYTNGPPGYAPPNPGGQAALQIYADVTTSTVIESRSYVYTWVSAYGEESAPSPYTLVNGWGNGTWTIGLWSPNPDDLGVLRNLAVLRLYRTVPSNTGATVYFWVADISLGSSDPDAAAFVAQDTNCFPPAATYIDTQTDAAVALHLQLPSTNFFPPPTNLQGMIIMPNGMIAGFENNEIWFCQPYYPHAWPPGYVQTTDFPIIGLGVTLGALVACTGATPYVLNGVSPSAVTVQRCSSPNPCISRGSIISTDLGVFFMSPNGLIQVVNSGTASNATELWITREKWDALTPSKNTRAIPLVGNYFCFGTVNGADTSVAQQGFTVELNTDSTSFTIWPQPGGHRVGFNGLVAPNGYNVDNILLDPWSGVAMIIQNGQVSYYDFEDQSPAIQPYDYVSKIYQQPSKRSYAALRVFFTAGANTPPVNDCPNEAPANDPSWATLQSNQRGIIKIYADPDDEGYDGTMQLVTCREITQSGGILRIESGFKAENWQFEILGTINISNIQIATSVKELRNI